jgi:WD40 repeat protein
MSGSILRARGWNVGDEEQYLAVSPNAEIVSLYQTNNQAINEEDNILKVAERTGFENIQCINYSNAKPGLTAIGQLNGKCLLFDIRNTQIEPVILKPLQSRSCNSVSFNENGLIAMGYDRGRQDHSIHVWDINSFQRGDFLGKTSKIFSCITNESISSLSFCPNEPKNFVTGSYKLLREYDVRSNQPIYQIATRCTLNISVNPFTPFMFASNSEDGSLAIWDRRKLSESFQINNAPQNTAVSSEGPILLFNKLLNDYQRRTNGSPYRFSSVQSGEIGALFDGDLVRRWKIENIPPLSSELSQYEQIFESSKRENPAFVSKIAKPAGSMFISKVHDTKTKYERVISFDYAPSKTSAYGIDLVCMRQSGSIYKMKVIDSQNGIVFNSYNDVAFCGSNGVCSKFVKDEVTDRTRNINDKVSGLSITNQAGESLGNGHVDTEDDAIQNNGANKIIIGKDSNTDYTKKKVDVYVGEAETMCLTPDKLLENDICTSIRRRATRGYGVDAKKNMEILDSMETYETQLHLKNAWKWIDISYNLISAGKMNFADFDFGYLGVLGIWNMDKDFMIFNRYSGFRNVTEKDVTNAARGIVERRSKECNLLAKPVIGFSGRSSKEIQRRLAMYVIGWDFGVRDLEEKYISLIANGNYERAAGWAIFHGDVNRAITILGESNNESYRIMSTAIAAYTAFKDSDTNNTWKDRCRQLASDLADPYLRIIFAYVADGNWWDVLDESALPLRERLGVALRFLPDSELEIYLNRLAESVIERGDVEGIILTGITMNGIKLLQSFVDRNNDIQSACLIATFASPKYFFDERVENWVENYRSLLNSWSLFSARAKFDIARTRLSKKLNEQNYFKHVPRQLYLQCINCHKSITRDDSSDIEEYAKKPRKTNNNHSCDHCGYPLPRCAICLITQGVSVPKEIMHMRNPNIEEDLNIGFRQGSNGLNRLKPTENSRRDQSESQFKEWFSFCLSCNHCMHVGHAEEWFAKHYVCPVPDCECKCNNR